MNNTILWFHLTPEEMLLLAAYVAQLVKEDVQFTVRRDEYSVEVKLTGGF